MAPLPVTSALATATSPVAEGQPRPQVVAHAPPGAARHAARCPPSTARGSGQHQHVEVGTEAVDHGVGPVGQVLGGRERGRARPGRGCAFIRTGHHARAATSHAASDQRGDHRRRRPAQAGDRPIERAATSATRATAVTKPSFLDMPATSTRITAAARVDGSDRSCSPKATAPTAASDHSGSA